MLDSDGFPLWNDWRSDQPGRLLGHLGSRIVGFQRGAAFALLLDLVEGTLSVYQSDQRLGTLKDGLSGEYCWFATAYPDTTISIERGSDPGE